MSGMFFVDLKVVVFVFISRFSLYIRIRIYIGGSINIYDM